MTVRRVMAGVAALMTVYAALAWGYVRKCSPTYDEPVHLMSSYVIRDRGDVRVNPDHPPLWQRWVGLALPAGSLAPMYGDANWGKMLDDSVVQMVWGRDSMYPRPMPAGYSVEKVRAALGRGRAMVLVWSVATGVATGALAWVLAGAVGLRAAQAGWATLVASAMFALDPNLLGHGAIVKNDLIVGLAFAGVAIAVIKLGQRVTAGWVAALGLALGVGVTTKFSGVALCPMAVGLLMVRAVLPGEWGRLREMWRKLGAAVGVGLVCAVMVWGIVWAVYGFRFEVSPGGPVAEIGHDLDRLRSHVAMDRAERGLEEGGGLPVATQAVVWAYDHRLMPSAWCKGFLFIYATTYLRESYLLSELSDRGWWDYFPLCVAFKEPLGTMGLLGIGLGVLAWGCVRARMKWEGDKAFGVIVVVGITAVYGASAMSGHLDGGIRYLLPVYPLVIAGVGVGVAGKVLGSRAGRVVVGVMLAGMLVETGASHDRLISFFNVPARMYGPERLLGDSNLDWGQDLPKVAAWEARHPEVELSGLFFSIAPPEDYGVRYVPLLGSMMARGERRALPKEGVVAVSATFLQEIYLRGKQEGALAMFRKAKPREVLGGTIFLYDLPLNGEGREWVLTRKPRASGAGQP